MGHRWQRPWLVINLQATRKRAKSVCNTENLSLDWRVDFFLKDFIYLFRERGREGEREGEKHQCVVAFHMAPHWGPGLQLKHMP